MDHSLDIGLNSADTGEYFDIGSSVNTSKPVVIGAAKDFASAAVNASFYYLANVRIPEHAKCNGTFDSTVA
jgi:hypothetical protein